MDPHRQHDTGEFSIRKAEDVVDYTDCEFVQRQAWSLPEAEMVPLNILRPICEKGGLVMNAYDKNGRPVGTCISLLGRHAGKLMLYSHMLGVVPEFQRRGVGFALKLRQRQHAMELGVDLVCWTYDPMQSVNNCFNLTKLGAVAKTYYVNYYGVMADKLNQGLETDRFLAEWWILSPRVTKRIETAAATEAYRVKDNFPVVNPTSSKNGTRIPSGELNLSFHSETVLVEIPYEYDHIRALDVALLQCWRENTRTAYRHAFDQGYIATGTVVENASPRRSFVMLERRPLERILQG